ncbi:MAG: hypothetical protein LAT54_07565 [Cryomorphaceae bacterium]|nr:hypothetical protein [Cryomorphaceae bacterium]
MFRFRAFKATNDINGCENYRDGHRQVLIDYGISNITTNTNDWMYNPYMYCIVVELEETGEVVGGVRIQISHKDKPLPVEEAVGKIDPKVIDWISSYRNNGGVGELCALWNAKKVAGMGLSLLLIRAGISVVNQVHINSLVTICADYTMWMVRRVGFMVEASLGCEGEFHYPNENYIARILHRINTNTLIHAEEHDRQCIFDLRHSPVQTKIEKGNKGDVLINYNLYIKQ